MNKDNRKIKASAKKAKQLKKNKTLKKKYYIRNWPEYNEALRKRGMIDMWIEKPVTDNWYAPPTGKPGAQIIYSDLAVISTLQLGKVFSQRLRQTEGLAISLFNLLRLDLKVPDHSTLSRRGGKVRVRIPKREKEEKLVLVLDSTGLKVYGEGEWKVRKHGYSKRREWRKFHFGITPDGEFRSMEVTSNSISDDTATDDLLIQEQSEIGSLIADGAYDKKKVYDLCQDREIEKIIIPPRKDAKIIKHGNSKGLPHPRDENLRAIKKSSLKAWKEASGFHTRSLAENAVFRFKTIFGDRLEARSFPQQVTEVLIKGSILNKMMNFGMPDSYAINATG